MRGCIACANALDAMELGLTAYSTTTSSSKPTRRVISFTIQGRMTSEETPRRVRTGEA